MTVNQKNRWTPASYSGDPSTENPNAKFPRLTYGENKNNNRASTFWLADGRYLRLKNVEIGYTLPKHIYKRLGMSSIRVYAQGVNLLTFSKFKLWDPELDSNYGNIYPQMRTITLGLNLNF